MSDIADEISEVREKLGIGLSVDDRIKKVLVNQYQYASAGDTKAFVDEITRLRAEVAAAYERGQMDMRERAAVEADEFGDCAGFEVAETIRFLPVEEWKG